jgi:hypothetical protein
MDKKSVWGPALWLYMHVSADFCEDSDAFCVFLHTLTKTLPCPDCRRHLLAYLEKNPPAQVILDSKSASAYVRDLHDHVNMITNKPIFPPLPRPPPIPPARAQQPARRVIQHLWRSPAVPPARAALRRTAVPGTLEQQRNAPRLRRRAV